MELLINRVRINRARPVQIKKKTANMGEYKVGNILYIYEKTPNVTELPIGQIEKYNTVC